MTHAPDPDPSRGSGLAATSAHVGRHVQRRSPLWLLPVASAAPALLAWRDRSYDLQYHLFFASHYLNSWFDPWDKRWYGGFLVYAYPPLIHQLLAAIGAAVGLDNAGRLLVAATLTALGPAVVRLARLVGDADSTLGAHILFLAWPAPYLFLFDWGQLTVVDSLVFALLAVGSLIHYLQTGKTREVWLWALLAGCAAASQPEGAFLLLPALAAAATVTAAAPASAHFGATAPDRAAPGIRTVAGRAAVAATAAAAAVAVAVAPFLWWLATQSKAQASIPHPSRTDFLAGGRLTSLYFTAVWGGLLAVAPIVLLLGRPRALPKAWAALCLIYLALGFGFLTPLPKILFPGWATWLTYEIFGLWAGALLIVLAALRAGNPPPRARRTLGIIGLAATAAVIAVIILPDRLPPADTATVSNLAAFLRSHHQTNGAYATLELGDNRFTRLSRLAPTPTIDGYYFMARTNPQIRASGVGTIDSAIDTPKGASLVDGILAQPSAWALLWVITPDPRLAPRLRDDGWSNIACVGPPVHFLDQLECVSIWEAPALTEAEAAAATRPATSVPAPFPIFWGVAPCLELGLAALVAATRNRTSRRTAALGRRPELRQP